MGNDSLFFITLGSSVITFGFSSNSFALISSSIETFSKLTLFLGDDLKSIELFFRFRLDSRLICKIDFLLNSFQSSEFVVKELSVFQRFIYYYLRCNLIISFLCKRSLSGAFGSSWQKVESLFNPPPRRRLISDKSLIVGIYLTQMFFGSFFIAFFFFTPVSLDILLSLAKSTLLSEFSLKLEWSVSQGYM